LHFYEQDNSANKLKGKVDELLSQSRVVRAAGDAGLMRWIR
jgi:cell division protein FtsL